jgi:hypothetical protein
MKKKAIAYTKETFILKKTALVNRLYEKNKP